MAEAIITRRGVSVELTGDAVVADVLATKTFYKDDPKTKLTGTMTNKVGSTTVITPSTADQTIEQGYYGGAAADGKVLGDADLVAGNIKTGVNIFGVAGTFPIMNAGNYEIYNNPIERQNTTTTPTVVNDIVFLNDGTYRITFNLKTLTAGGYYAAGRIYKDGSAFGTLRTTANTSFVNYSEDITCSAGEHIQLYIWRDTGQAASNEFKVKIGSDISVLTVSL